jgi:glucose-1-phosphate adenylyltransferase
VTVVPPILVLILAGGKSGGLHALGRIRTASALPYGGKYRVIDFTLSNCVHSGLARIAILTQYAPLSLHGHIGIGRAWDLDRRDGGVRLLQPYVRQSETNWYRGTADALVQNLNVIRDAQARHILVLSGDLVYTMDYGELIRWHEDHDAALTVVTTRAPSHEPERYGYIRTDRAGRITAFVEKPRVPDGETISAAVYLFRASELRARLERPGPALDLVGVVVLPLIGDGTPVYAYPHPGYWRDVGTIDSYYDSNMDLVRPVPPLNLYDPDWLIYTPTEDRSPAVIGRSADVRQCLISHGARVEGTVRNSVLFPGVHVGAGALVEESIVMHDARIRPGARLSRAIVDKRVDIGAEATLGSDEATPNREFPRDLCGRLTVVGKGSVVPPGARVGSNTLIEMGVTERDYPGRDIPAGSVIRPGGSR